MNKESINVESVVDWLVDGARTAKTSQDVLLGLCEQLVECGVQISRVAVFVTTLHPNVMGRGFYWRFGNPEVDVGEAPYSVTESEEFKQNPIARVYAEGIEIRRKLCDPDCPDDFKILAQLRDEGVTDYLATPLHFTSGEVHGATWSTEKKGGFSDAEITALRRIQPALARLAEILALRRTAANLLDAYLGHQSGTKVLSGQVKRGDGQEIFAVIWFCDLRGSTPLADSMSRQDFLGLLNDYFECMAGAVLDNGGEVLRFIGDAVLAIFPISETDYDLTEACNLAAGGAKDAINRMDALNAQRVAAGKAELGYGIGLHLGNVMYGNIGTPDRIEFTVIGAAANEAARIESLCKELGENFLLSGEVVKHLPGEWRSLGDHSLRGVGEKIEIFTLP
ncbi:MAG: adenylate/guanylate cyclase domain-containing protein [Proteobacteria bacterium]|nr:adenylate/guanylate cyclase domain-containing protein [Pseudomonadota bacterium]